VNHSLKPGPGDHERFLITGILVILSAIIFAAIISH